MSSLISGSLGGLKPFVVSAPVLRLVHASCHSSPDITTATTTTTRPPPPMDFAEVLANQPVVIDNVRMCTWRVRVCGLADCTRVIFRTCTCLYLPARVWNAHACTHSHSLTHTPAPTRPGLRHDQGGLCRRRAAQVGLSHVVGRVHVRHSLVRAYFQHGHTPSSVGRAKHLRVMAGAVEGDTFIGRKTQDLRGLLKLRYPMEHGVVTDWYGAIASVSVFGGSNRYSHV